jgi:hypothetical protein
MKKTWREVCICLQEDFKALGDVKKNAFFEYCHTLLNTADLNSYKHVFLLFYVLYCSYEGVLISP